MTDKPTITQADREAASEYRQFFYDYQKSAADQGYPDLSKALAKHRESAVAELQAENERLRDALETIQNESRRPLVRLVHLKRCIAAQYAALSQKEPVE